MAKKKVEANEEQGSLIDEEIISEPTVIESMDAQKVDWNIGYLVEMMDNGIVNFDTPIQRGYVWNKKRDSLLIRSILRRIPISNFYFNKVNNVYEGLEGKQRSSAIYRFVKEIENCKLHANTPSIKVDGKIYQIARKKFSDLPKTLQNRILSYAIDGHWFDNMSVDEKVEFFILTNSGKAVTPAEISRIRIKSRNVFLSLAEHPAMQTAITMINRRKCKDEDILAQLWCLCYGETNSLLQKDIGPILAIKDVTKTQKAELVNALDYLEEFYKIAKKDKSKYNKTKKPTHILSAAYMAFLASNIKKMDKETFIKKADSFFDGEGRTVTVSEEYNKAVGTGSSKPEQVKIRIQELEKALI